MKIFVDVVLQKMKSYLYFLQGNISVGIREPTFALIIIQSIWSNLIEQYNVGK